jgi:hypothetical protein
MPRQRATKVLSESHQTRGRKGLEGRQRDALGRLLPRHPVTAPLEEP